MPVSTRLILKGYRPISEILAPLGDELDRCFWAVDVQSGPFNDPDVLPEAQFWEVPAFKDSSTIGLRPGTLPKLAGSLIVDEWSYYFALDAPENQALRQAIALARHIGDFSEEFLGELDQVADLFICHADGWWEFYTGKPDWHRQLLAAWPDCVERPLSGAGNVP